MPSVYFHSHTNSEAGIITLNMESYLCLVLSVFPFTASFFSFRSKLVVIISEVQLKTLSTTHSYFLCIYYDEETKAS